MSTITTEQVKELRDATGVSVMQCRKALEEANGDMEAAMILLRKKGSEIADKKAEAEKARKLLITAGEQVDDAHLSEERTRLRKKIEKLGLAKRKMDALVEQRKAAYEARHTQVTVITLAREIVKREKLSDKPECPTCGSEIDARRMAKQVSKARAEIALAEEKVAAIDAEIEKLTKAIDARSEIDRITKRIGKDDIDVSKATGEARRAQKMLDQCEAAKEAAHKFTLLRSERASIKGLLEADDDTETTKRERKMSPEELADAIKVEASNEETLSEYGASVKQFIRLCRKSKADTKSDFSGALKNARRELKNVEDKLEEASRSRSDLRERVESLEANLAGYERTRARYLELEPKIKRLREAEHDERVLKSLVKAYGPGGLKVKRMRYLLEQIREKLPIWTGLLFTERNVKIDVIGNTKKIGFEVRQTRTRMAKSKRKSNVQNGVETYDIRYDAKFASGSERTRISMCLLLTLGDVAASEKSCNLQVFDELERGMDAQSKRILTEDVLPLLAHQKPSLFVIAHTLDIPRQDVNAELQLLRKHEQTTTKFVRVKDTTGVAHRKPSRTKNKKSNRRER